MPRLAWISALLLFAAPALAQQPEPKGVLHRLKLGDGVGDTRFSPDGKLLAVGDFDSTISLFDPATGTLSQTLKGHTGRVTCVAWSPDSRTLASGSDDGSIRFWEVQSGKETGCLANVHGRGSHGTGTTTVGFFPDGKRLFSTGYDPLVRIWDVAGLKEIRNLPGHRDCTVACISPDGKRLATASQDGTGRIWDPATGQSLQVLDIQPRIQASSPHLGYPCFSPDGSRLFAGGGDGRIRSWIAPDWKAEAGWTAHRGFIGALDVSPDGAFLASGGMQPEGGIGTPDQSWDNEIRIWNTATGESLLELSGHKMSICRARFSADGTRLATASWDGTVLIWDLVLLQMCPKSADGEDAEALWDRLGQSDGPRSWVGVRALISKPEKALELFGARLQPARPDPDFSAKIARLIKDLDDDNVTVREKAQDSLTRLGPRAEAALRQALEVDPPLSPEVRMRARQILEVKSDWSPGTEDERRWMRSMSVLETIGGDKAIAILEKLSGGDADSALTAAARTSLAKLKGK
ncbi:MAG: hypothetical protein K8T20_10955 [Planctomycetes bacterium]|nr:hypothetical protein [Planctomycetota bacterium]